jgi:hypothetical protein
MMTRSKIVAAIAPVLALLALAGKSSAQAPGPELNARNETGFLPSAAFGLLIADPREQQFGTALRQGDFTSRGSLDGIASFGASLPIVGFTAGSNLIVQVGAAGGLIARFDMHTRANDLVSEDYEIGFPVWFRSGRIGGRFRVYHRSSHIGDEFTLNNPDFTRLDVTYEALEGIIGASMGPGRVYIGGDYIYHNATTDVDPGTLRIGGDIASRPVVNRATMRGRLIAGLDVEGYRDLDWRAAKSAVAGIELSRLGARSSSMRILLELFSGPSSAGQFYGQTEKYAGLAMYITP